MEERPRQGLDDLVQPNSDQFLKLFLKHQTQIYGYIISLIPNVADAQDIFQESSTVMWKKFHTFEPGTNFVAWCIRIAHLDVLCYYRKHKNRKVTFDSNAIACIVNETERRSSDFNDRIDALEQCIDGLSVNCKYLIKLRYEKTVPVRDIATQLGKSVSSVYKVFARIHLQLQRCMHRRLSIRGIQP